MCGVCKRYTKIGELDAFGLARRSECEGCLYAVGTIALSTTVVIDGGRLAQFQSQCTVVALGHEHLVLQRTSAFGVASSGSYAIATHGNTEQCGIDGGVLFSIGIDVGFHREEVVALSQLNSLGKVDCHLSSGSGLAQFGAVLPYADFGQVSFSTLQVQLHAAHCQGIQVALGLHVHGEQFLIGSTDGDIGCAGLCSLYSSNLHVLR